VNQPNNKSIVSSKWVLKLKKKPDGSIDKFKARLVARGFSQTQGVDFTETFAPTLRMETIRFILNYALANEMEIHHMDVTAAFLNGELQEEIYLKLPEGFAQLHQDPSLFNGKVALLKKSLYGLKQSMRCWNTKLTTYLNCSLCGRLPNHWKATGSQQREEHTCEQVQDDRHGSPNWNAWSEIQDREGKNRNGSAILPGEVTYLRNLEWKTQGQ
jgi:hypothetical protein